MIQFRVYDAASIRKEYTDYLDRYALYVPTPKQYIKEWGHRGVYLCFSIGTDNQIIHCTWEECIHGARNSALGRKINRNDLPLNVQEWINQMEECYNKAIEENTEESWKKWNTCNY